jgi:hypothetical protein
MMSVTVVSCYYKFPSKHGFQEYDLWMNNFLENINCNLVIFTSPDLEKYIMDKRVKFIHKTKVICETIEDNELYIKYKDQWDYQHSIDKQKNTGRSKFCYIIWNSKLNYMKKIIDFNPFNSDKFVWTDIGCLRNNNPLLINQIQNYPNYNNISSDKLDIVLLRPFTNPLQDYFQDEVHFAGAVFGSDYKTILKIHDLFYDKLDELSKKYHSISSEDEEILNKIFKKYI